MDIMMIFNAILTLFGCYLMVSAFKMKKTGEISRLLVAEEEQGHCKKKKAFIESIYKKEAILGGVMAVVGILGFVHKMGYTFPYAKIVETVLFFLVFLWFSREMRNAKAQYFF